MVKTFLQTGDPPPARIIRARAKGPCLIICDHASSRIPKAFQKTFGVSRKDLNDHMGVDVGAAKLTLDLSRKLNSAAILANYSRLFMEMNRKEGHKHSIQTDSHGIEIPGNKGLTKAQKKQRRDVLLEPYHQEIEGQVDRILGEGRMPLQVYIHSFTPEALNKKMRPWHIGLLWHQDKKNAALFMKVFKKQNPNLIIGSNQPYSFLKGSFVRYSAERHAENHGLPYLFIEVRNDQLSSTAKISRWGDRIIRAMKPVLEKIP